MQWLPKVNDRALIHTSSQFNLNLCNRADMHLQLVDKHRKPTTRRPIHYSAGAKNRIENDIRNSLVETASLRRLEALAKDRREQLHRRYNNLEGLNMADMTDEEITQYVMLLSKQQDDQDDQDEQEAAQIAREIRLIQEMETELALKQQTHSALNDHGEGSSSSSAPSGRLSTATPSQQELEEEEEMVRRVIAMSLLEVDPSPDDVHSHDHAQGHLQDEDTQEPHNHVYQPTDWETSQVVNVDGLKRDDHEKQEDEQIVKSILRELEEVEDDTAPSQGANDEDSPGDARPPQAKNVDSGEAPKMTWSMIARVNNNESPAPAASGLQPAIIKRYPRDASQEEIEDEDTQLARILSLSMVEK
jgi:hypothetical protein